MQITRVLRIGKRYYRDERVTTHLCLVSRAFGAEKIYLEDAENNLLSRIEEINNKWGGSFSVEIGKKWNRVVAELKSNGWCVVHLTMYGIPLAEKISEIRSREKILVVVGGPKVPGEMYKLADYNLSITSQPHSEIAALAIFLHELYEGKELIKEFENSKIRILPSNNEKKVVKV